MKTFVGILLICVSFLSGQEFSKAPLISLSGQNKDYDVMSPGFYYDNTINWGNQAFLCFLNQNQNRYSIFLNRLPISGENSLQESAHLILIHSDSLPLAKPSISFTEDYNLRIVWQAKVQNHWQLFTRVLYLQSGQDSLGAIGQLTHGDVDCTEPAVYFDYVSWLKNEDLYLGKIGDTLQTLLKIDENCSQPKLMYPAFDSWPLGNLQLLYQKKIDTLSVIKLLSIEPDLNYASTDLLSDTANNANPQFGYWGDVTYQKKIDGVWRAVIPGGIFADWISDNRDYNVEHPVYFTFPALTDHYKPNSVREYFLLYESDSLKNNREIIFRSWLSKKRFNISDLAGDDTNPYAVLYGDSVAIFWIHWLDAENSQIWWAKDLFEPPTGIDDTNTAVVNHFELLKIFPNPFNARLQIEFKVPDKNRVKITVYNAAGQQVVQLLNQVKPAGHFRVVWEAGKFGSGLYFVKLNVGKRIQVRKAILIK